MTTITLNLPDHFPDENVTDEMILAIARKNIDEALIALGEEVAALFDVLGAPKTMKVFAYAAAATGLDILAEQLETFAAAMEEDELDKTEAWENPLEDFEDFDPSFSGYIITIEPDDLEPDDK